MRVNYWLNPEAPDEGECDDPFLWLCDTCARARGLDQRDFAQTGEPEPQFHCQDCAARND